MNNNINNSNSKYKMINKDLEFEQRKPDIQKKVPKLQSVFTFLKGVLRLPIISVAHHFSTHWELRPDGDLRSLAATPVTLVDTVGYEVDLLLTTYVLHIILYCTCIYIYNLIFWILLRYQMIIMRHCLDPCWVFVFPPTFKNLSRSYPHLGNKGLRNWWPQPAVWCSEWPIRPTVDGSEIRLTTWDVFETLWILEYLLHQLVQDFFQQQYQVLSIKHKTFTGFPKQKRLRSTWIQHKHFQSYGRYLNE